MAECPTRRIVFIDQVANEVDIHIGAKGWGCHPCFIYSGIRRNADVVLIDGAVTGLCANHAECVDADEYPQR